MIRESGDVPLGAPPTQTAPSDNPAALQSIEKLIAERQGNADIDKARAFLRRTGGEPPREDDVLPTSSTNP